MDGFGRVYEVRRRSNSVQARVNRILGCGTEASYNGGILKVDGDLDPQSVWAWQSIDAHIGEYERQLRVGGLPDIPLHMVCLLHGRGDYEGLDAHTRKGLLSRFNAFVRGLPISYHTFSYRSYDVSGVRELSARMRRDLVNFVYGRFESFQSFDRVVVFYDEGQQAVTRALHEAFDFMLGDGAVEYKKHRYQDSHLSQVADYLSSIELAAMRYAEGVESSTYRKFYGLRGDLRRNYLKQIRRKLI